MAHHSVRLGAGRHHQHLQGIRERELKVFGLRADGLQVGNEITAHLVLSDGRYEPLIRHEDSVVGEVWSAHDAVLDRSVQIVICDPASCDDVDDLDARIASITDHPAASFVQQYVGTVRTEHGHALIFESPQGSPIGGSSAAHAESIVEHVVAAVCGINAMIADGVVPPELDLAAVHRTDEGVMWLHPYVSGQSLRIPSDEELLERLDQLVDQLVGGRERTVASRRIHRAFPQLSSVLEALRADTYGSFAEAVGALDDAVSAQQTSVLVVGGGPIVVDRDSARIDTMSGSASQVRSESALSHLQLVETDDFDLHDPDYERSRFALPSRTVRAIFGAVIVLCVVLIVLLKPAQHAGSLSAGRVPAADMRRLMVNVSKPQRVISDNLGAYHSKPNELALLRASGTELEQSATTAEERIRRIKPSSQPEAELQQSAISLVSAQRALGHDIAGLDARIANVSSVDAQVVMLNAQMVTKQFVSMSMALRSVRQPAMKSDPYVRLPINGKVFLDAVMDVEWKRQSDELAARMRAQQAQLRDRITAAERAFRAKMLDSAYQAWSKQFYAIKARAQSEMARGRSIASRFSSGGCEFSSMQASISTRGMLLFQLNTLAPPNQQALSAQINLQKDLLASTAGDFGLVFSSSPKKLVSCATQ